ncbi:Flp pilus assembly protein CpaB [Hydrogenophaga sp. PAMC20947]|uniref:Flp pilus assembly protein CpaB n=1 Tax=Hydrogenophaga sp. PAMC20947 TaxID=2565558 RepID=UPI00109E1B20|nr:Flp pilus assembly protein CpaB [Hydrogenophaga sp. PAMC20947]QCB47243.1 Flp pilus assembly protein CpaB [Hydrogenophaga sp. PAMC20947]
MNKFSKNWLFLALAIGLGIVAFYLSNKVISNRMQQIEAELKASRETVRVVVASRALSPGDILSNETASVREFPREFLHDSALAPEDFSKIEGEALLVGVRAGEPILPVYTVTRGGAFFSGSIKEGRRALTIEVDELSSIAGLVRPGDRIDLIMSAKPRDQGGAMGGAPQESFTFPLFSSVEVLATGKAQRGSGGNIESYSTVTLNVTPQQANDIIAAKAEAKVTAVLRSQKDDFPNTSQATSVSDVVAAAARLKRLNTTEYIVGGRGANGGASIVTSVPVTSAVELPGATPQSLSAAPFPTLSAIK